MNAQLINLYRQAEDYFFRGISLKYMKFDDGVHAYMTGVPIADLNFVYITKNINTFTQILSQCNRFFDQDNLSFVVIIPQEFCTTGVEGIFSTMGYHQTGQSVSMAIKLEEMLVTGSSTDFDEAVIHANDNQLSDWINPLVGAFESTIEICSMYMATHESALKKNMNLRHFSLYQKGMPIASITLSTHNTIARIDDVGTLPEFQGKGYATYLMRYVLSEAKKLGVNHCFLESSNSGFGVYQKLGFEPLFKNNIYSKKT